MTPDLFSPLALRDRRARNRVMVSPMCQYSCERDGLATDWHRVHLGSRAVGGAGIVMTGATAVEPRGRISPRDLGIWSDEHCSAFEPITQFISDQGALPAIQLAHAGRKASTAPPFDGGGSLSPEEGGWTAVGPSGTPYPRDGDPVSTERLATGQIEHIVDRFAAAAQRAAAAGFAIAEVHAAHGYLLHSFLSPVTNDRTDEYGGSFENRTRLVREVVAAVRKAWPAGNPVFVRISATDWLSERDSWTLSDSTELAPMLVEAGADLIDVSAGGLHPVQSVPSTGPNYMVPLAEAVRDSMDCPVGAVGKITTPEQATAIIENGRADLAILGREHLRDPYFMLHAAETLSKTDRVDIPPQYERGF